jgi:asparagine synthase (glutamine-hydrolysing)
MCGIYFCFSSLGKFPSYNEEHLIKRGPDCKKIITNGSLEYKSDTIDSKSDTIDTFKAVFYRLSIVDLEHGMQPFIINGKEKIIAFFNPDAPLSLLNPFLSTEVSDNKLLYMANGEIYNHKELETQYSIQCKTKSDCEVIGHLYKKVGIEQCASLLKGEWAFIIYDNDMIYFARDRLGRKPLFYKLHYGENRSLESDGKSSNKSDLKINTIEISSLYSATNGIQCKPGMLYAYDCIHGSLSEQPYHTFMYKPNPLITNESIYKSLVSAVNKRITQSERPVGFLLSGGFDSSAVLSLALESKLLKQPPHVFTIGFEEKASDVLAAESMVKWLTAKYGKDCLVWHKVILPIEDGLSSIPNVIEALETYDTTTIRASVPMYLISKYISEKTDVRVVLSGEGSDELFGGYLYFKYAPNDVHFRAEIIRLLNRLYLYDVLRADRSTATHGLEIRVPFLDDDFVECVLQSYSLKSSSINTKALIRDALEPYNVLPDNILKGKKEAFSDAVGHSWKDSIPKYAELHLKPYMNVYSCNIYPTTTEEKYYQMLFRIHYKSSWHLLDKLWLPNQDWVKTGNEPSARALPNY